MSREKSLLLGILTVGFLCLAIAAAQSSAPPAADEVQPPPDQMEVPHFPYAPVPPGSQRTSPARLWISRDGRVSSQVNVNALGQNIIGDAANEPSIAVSLTNPSNMAIGWRQFDTIQSDFRQAGWGYTFDGGATWTFPGKIEPGHFRSDPVVDTDPNGVFYYNSLTNEGGYQCKVFRSFNGGVSWDAGTYAYGGDKQWQVIDTTNSAGRGNIYANWTQAYSICSPGHFTRSTNGGNSFEACRSIPGTPYWGTMAVGPDGELYVSGDGYIVAKSLNAKFAGQTPTWTTATVNLDGSMIFSGGPNPGGLAGQVNIDVDKSGGDTNGYVYLLCSVDRNSISDPADVMFARSTNGGQTWSSPVRINDDPTGNGAWQWFGVMSVAPNGRIDVAWLDTRNDPGGYDSELYYSYSVDAGVSWAPNIALSPPFDPHVGWPVQNKIGDYYDMTSDNTGARLAYAATFNGEEDVYYTYITRGLAIMFPNGLPQYVTPGQPSNMTIRIFPGEEQYVEGSGLVHYRFTSTGPYFTSPLQPLGGELYQATLPAMYCGATPSFFFTAEGTQSGTVTTPTATPIVGVIAPVYSFDLTVNPGWTISGGQWAFGHPTGQGGASHGYPDPNNGATGANVYGVNLAGDYSTTQGGPYHLTSGALDLSSAAGTKLRFQRWLNSDYEPYVYNNVYVSTNGTNWTQVWAIGAAEITENAWSTQEYDLSALADHQPTVYLRWSYQIGSGAWAYSGWNIDDIQVTAFQCDTPLLHPGDLDCDGDVDFDDINPFVLALSDYAAYALAFPNCLLLNGDCNGDEHVNFDDINAFVSLLAK